MTGRIRRVCPSDLPAVVALCAEHAAYEGADYAADGQEARLAQAFFGSPPSLYGWVAVTESDPVGYMTVTRDYATWPARFFLHMDCLYLRAEHRGHGLGRAFMEALIAFAEVHQCDVVQWQTPPDNALGIGFYERMGAFARDKKRYFLCRKQWRHGRSLLPSGR